MKSRLRTLIEEGFAHLRQDPAMFYTARCNRDIPAWYTHIRRISLALDWWGWGAQQSSSKPSLSEEMIRRMIILIRSRKHWNEAYQHVRFSFPQVHPDGTWAPAVVRGDFLSSCTTGTRISSCSGGSMYTDLLYQWTFNMARHKSRAMAHYSWVERGWAFRFWPVRPSLNPFRYLESMHLLIRCTVQRREQEQVRDFLAVSDRACHFLFIVAFARIRRGLADEQ